MFFKTDEQKRYIAERAESLEEVKKKMREEDKYSMVINGERVPFKKGKGRSTKKINIKENYDGNYTCDIKEVSFIEEYWFIAFVIGLVISIIFKYF